MKNITKKIMLLLIMLILSSVMLITPALASEYKPQVIEPQSSDATTPITNAGGQVAGIIAAIAAGVAIVILIWLAIKYMTGSASDKADIKKSAVPYIIGAVLLFAASGVLTIIKQFGQGLGTNLKVDSGILQEADRPNPYRK